MSAALALSPCPSWCTGAHDELACRDRDGTGFVLHRRTLSGRVEVIQHDTTDRDGTVSPGPIAIELDGHMDAPLTISEARELALKLLEVTDGIERAPRRGDAPERFRSRPVLPRYIHDVLCGWRFATPAEDRPGVAWCAGCSCAIAMPPLREGTA